MKDFDKSLPKTTIVTARRCEQRVKNKRWAWLPLVHTYTYTTRTQLQQVNS